MEDGRLDRRIRVVLVTTRVAVASLEGTDGRGVAAIHRGLALLAALSEEIALSGDERARDQLELARNELGSLLTDRRD